MKAVVTVAVAGATASIAGPAAATLTENGKTWGSSRRPHFDRAMALWLIKRFIDKDAKFVFADKIDQLPAGVIPVGFPTGELSAVEPVGGSCFHKVVQKYKVDDPAILRLEKMNSETLVWTRMSREGADWSKQPVPVDMGDRYARWGFGLLGVSDAFARQVKTDQDSLDLNFPIFDAIYNLITLELKKT